MRCSYQLPVSVTQTETGWSELVSWLWLAGWLGGGVTALYCRFRPACRFMLGQPQSDQCGLAGTNKEGKIFEILKILSCKRKSTILSSNTIICFINE